MQVFKFGGSSLADAEKIGEVIQIIKKYRKNDLVVVVSAIKGSTDLLLKTGLLASQGKKAEADKNLEKLKQNHHSIIKNLISNNVVEEVDEHLNTLKDLLFSINALGELTPRSCDYVASFGEKLSLPIIVKAMNERGVKAEAVSADKFIKTDNNFMNAHPIRKLTEKRTVQTLKPILDKGIIPVVTGYIGSTVDNVVTTLGRGGSDYSASLIAANMDADEICKWTDVCGLMTADPKLFSGAKTIDKMTFVEATEFAHFGSKIIHPKTLLPAIRKNIPVRIRCTYEPEHEGTLIVDNAQVKQTVKAITTIDNVSLICLEGAGMLRVPGIAARVFSCVAREKINIIMIAQSSSEQDISFLIPEEDTDAALKALNKEFSYNVRILNINKISADKDISLVAVIGEGMKNTPGIIGKILHAIGKNNINIMAASMGSTQYNVSFIVKKQDVKKTVKALHEEFELS